MYIEKKSNARNMFFNRHFNTLSWLKLRGVPANLQGMFVFKSVFLALFFGINTNFVLYGSKQFMSTKLHVKFDRSLEVKSTPPTVTRVHGLINCLLILTSPSSVLKVIMTTQITGSNLFTMLM